jgi:hypothetical protein
MHVIITGRKRIWHACIIAESRPAPLSKIMPSITAIPNKAIKPIAAETLNGVPVSKSAKTPPIIIDVRGSALKAAIENGLSRLPAPSGRFPQVAGLKIEADPSRPAGNRVLSIKVGDTPLDANKTYSVATIDFMARGGDDYVAFRAAKPVLPPADSPTVAFEVIDYITGIATIRTSVDGRIVLK